VSALSNTVIVVCGPTAVGKTAVAIELAQHLNAEIINADSRQVYSELHIGVAKPSPHELAAVPHHLIGTQSVRNLYGAGDFEKDALQMAEEIFLRGKNVILCGGTGMYIKAFCEGLDELPAADEDYRKYLHEQFSVLGITFLQEELRKQDPEALSRIDIENPQRLMRALEVIKVSGKPYSASLTGKKAQRPFHIIKIGLTMDRNELYQRINQRTLQMMADGLLEEAQALYEQRHYNALKTVGYKEIFDYLDGDCTLGQAVKSIQQHTRNYAKRQLTWFRADPEITWFTPDQITGIIHFIHTKS
jgi:tRNA dimethylallyltransferase